MSRRVRLREAAKYLGVSPRFLEKVAVTDKGPAYHRLSARLVVYDVADLDSWLSARRVRKSADGKQHARAPSLAMPEVAAA
jgi:hypothetical protein